MHIVTLVRRALVEVCTVPVLLVIWYLFLHARVGQFRASVQLVLLQFVS